MLAQSKKHKKSPLPASLRNPSYKYAKRYCWRRSKASKTLQGPTKSSFCISKNIKVTVGSFDMSKEWGRGINLYFQITSEFSFDVLSIERRRLERFWAFCTQFLGLKPRDAPGKPRNVPGRSFERAFNCRATCMYACAMHLYTAPDHDPTGCPDSFLREILSLQSAAQA